MSVTPKPPVAMDARLHPVVPCRSLAGLKEVAATVRNRESLFAIQVATLARAATRVKAVIAGRDATADQDATAATVGTLLTAATEEVSMRRRTATVSFRPEILRECLPAGAGTAIVCLVNVEAILVADMAMACMEAMTA